MSVKNTRIKTSNEKDNRNTAKLQQQLYSFLGTRDKNDMIMVTTIIIAISISPLLF